MKSQTVKGQLRKASRINRFVQKIRKEDKIEKSR